MKTQMTYEQAAKTASYALVSANASKNLGNEAEYHTRMAEVVGMAKLLATMFDKWEEDENGEMDAWVVMADIEHAIFE